MPTLPLIAFLAGLGLTVGLVPWLREQCAQRGWFLRAAETHHTHQEATPRVGGLALAGAYVGVELMIRWLAPERQAEPAGRNGLLLLCLAMFGLGLWDDLWPLRARWKLGGQVLIASTTLWFGVGLRELTVPFTGQILELGPWWGGVAAVVWLVALTNLINLIDGADGLAGGVALALMLLMSWIGFQVGGFAALALGMVGAVVGFLWFNLPSARVYLGDSGAYLLGFQIGLFSLVGAQQGREPMALVAPLFVLAYPIVDTAAALCRRGGHGLPLFRPDRLHLHHRLLGLGISPRTLAGRVYVIELVCLMMAVVAFHSGGNLIPLLLSFVLAGLLFLVGKVSFGRELLVLRRRVAGSRSLRRQVRDARDATRDLEDGRSHAEPLDILWPRVVSAAQQMGFSAVRLSLPGEVRVWEDYADGNRRRWARHHLRSGGCGGTFDVSAPVCMKRPGDRCRCTSHHPPRLRIRSCPCVANLRSFELLGELLTESFGRAAGFSVARPIEAAAPPNHSRRRTPLSEPTVSPFQTLVELTQETKEAL